MVVKMLTTINYKEDINPPIINNNQIIYGYVLHSRFFLFLLIKNINNGIMTIKRGKGYDFF